MLLPLEPVTAANGAFASRTKISMSEITSILRLRARASSVSLSAMPGDAITRVTPLGSRFAPARTSASGHSASSSSRPGGVSRLSMKMPCPPLRCR